MLCTEGLISEAELQFCLFPQVIIGFQDAKVYHWIFFLKNG